MPVPFVLAVIGTYAIGYGSNYLQSMYRKYFFTEINYEELYGLDNQYSYETHYNSNGVEKYIVYVDDDGVTNVIPVDDTIRPDRSLEKIGYIIVSDAQFILIPLWIILCMVTASVIFYKREMESGLAVLMKSSKKIANNELDFEIPKTRQNEIGLVCDSFEKMRKSLLKTSTENIRMTEEARRLNAVFSHDIRTPITVMKGYVDLLEQYVPEGIVSKEKELEILGLMHNQVDRLESYAQSMSSVQKLEDLVPKVSRESAAQILEEIQNSCRLIDHRVNVFIQNDVPTRTEIMIDKELVFEVVENIVSNASRYAKDKIQININCGMKYLEIAVLDDGEGFSEKILSKVGNPFLREDKAEDKHHFGLGIYISKLLCEKCGGTLFIENRNGAYVKVTFQIS